MNTGPFCLKDVIPGLGTASLVMLATDSPLGQAFALSLGFDIAADQGQGVVVLNLDESKTEAVSRMTCFKVQAGRDFVGLGGSRKDETSTLAPLVASPVLAPILVYDAPTPSLGEVQAKARQLKARQETLRLLIIHGLEPLWNRGDQDVEEAVRLIEGLRALSGELDLTVLAVVPLSARSARRWSAQPSPTTMLAFQRADLALLFQGEEVYDWHATGRRMAEITQVKPDMGKGRTGRLRITENFRFDELPAAS